MIVYLKIKTQKTENVTIGVKIILIEHKDTKTQRNKGQKSSKI